MSVDVRLNASHLGLQAISPTSVHLHTCTWPIVGCSVPRMGDTAKDKLCCVLCRYGLKTNGNILVNAWLGGRADGALNAVIAAYLAISIPPMQVCEKRMSL